MSSQRVDRSRRNHTHSSFPQSTKFPPKQSSSRQIQNKSGTVKPAKSLDPSDGIESNKVKSNESIEQDTLVLNKKIAEVMRDIEETERAINSTRHEIELQQNAIVLHQVLQSNYMKISENINKYVNLFEEEMKCEDERKERVTTGTNIIENTTTIEIAELCELITRSLKRRDSGLSSEAEEELLADSIQNLIRKYPSSEMMKALISSIRLMQRDLKTANSNNDQSEEM
ncbi:hypothetical protein BKA69DRAFT_118648 [Paraphysoderma sedebokerense]|nr:hypothetical protein BKA69DRAFT_118648 [Paraphysoderma sedebokerense]